MKRFIALGLALAALAGPARAENHDASPSGPFPEHSAVDPAAPAVTAANLLASERFWPYQTALTRPWQSLAMGSVGVLIRVEPGDKARVDFGRDGLWELPVAETDLVQRSNAVRLGRLDKAAPNLVYALGPRLLDPATRQIYPLERTASQRAFLCVFADPWRVDFGPLVSELEALHRPGLLPILFPQGRRPDSEVRGQLRAMKWSQPFVFDHLAEPYTQTLLASGAPLPAVQLVTPEGRVLLERRWSSAVAREIAALLDGSMEIPQAALRDPSDALHSDATLRTPLTTRRNP